MIGPSSISWPIATCNESCFSLSPWQCSAARAVSSRWHQKQALWIFRPLSFNTELNIDFKLILRTKTQRLFPRIWSRWDHDPERSFNRVSSRVVDLTFCCSKKIITHFAIYHNHSQLCKWDVCGYELLSDTINFAKLEGWISNMMTSSNGNIFRVTGHMCGEFTGRRWIPLTKGK